MKVVNQDGSGFPASEFSAPGGGGVQSIAVDPQNVNSVYLAAPNNRSADVGGGSGINIYRSLDGGRTFKAGNLNVSGDPNDNWRFLGERIAVDPNNSRIVYYGSGFGAYSTTGSGLYRSTDAGGTWNRMTPTNAFTATDNIINVLVDKSSGTTTNAPLGSEVGNGSKVIWASGGHNENRRFSGNLFRSIDGGVTWANMSAGTSVSGSVAQIYLASKGGIYVIQSGTDTLWKFSNSNWTSYHVDVGGALSGLAIDPKNPDRLFAIGGDSSTSRSVDGGRTWTNFGRLKFSNHLAWLPQTVGDAQAYGYRSNAGITFDSSGTLWICQGNEGMLRFTPSSENTESSSNPPKWMIDSKGIEELVSQDVIVPKGSGGRIYTAVEDATGMVIPNPDTWVASQIPLQTSLISQGTQVASCPNDPKTIAVSTSNVYNNGPNESGISFDAGLTWTKFGKLPTFTNSSGTFDIQAGGIAISRRGTWKAGSDHIVLYPVYSMAPVFSKDGGRTWAVTKSFPVQSDGISLESGYQGFWTFALKQRELVADPFVPDKFYLKLVNAPGSSFYESLDGGTTWTSMVSAGLPANTHHGQLAVNDNVLNDLWFVDGWEGASSHGVFHSTNGGKAFTRLPGISNAITLALGAGSGLKGDAYYSVYVYGKLDSDPKWGIFRSTNGGATWDRIAYYPTGIFDQPTCMAANWDTFGKVYVGFTGNSYVYGQENKP
jgi:hypothetical protein